MLEDDLERIARFQRVIQQHYPNAELTVFRTATAFIDGYTRQEHSPDLVCLDHDLFPDSSEDPDPGDGRDVAAFLVTQTPNAPALIHSTNASAADSMLFLMEEHGWNVERIAPLGDDWIESYWFPSAREMIAKHSNNRIE